MRDKERLEEIIHKEAYLEGTNNLVMVINTDDYKWLIRTVERYEKALEDISKVGWSDRFGGGFSYTGENHAECVKIAKQALESKE